MSISCQLPTGQNQSKEEKIQQSFVEKIKFSTKIKPKKLSTRIKLKTQKKPFPRQLVEGEKIENCQRAMFGRGLIDLSNLIGNE